MPWELRPNWNSPVLLRSCPKCVLFFFFRKELPHMLLVMFQITFFEFLKQLSNPGGLIKLRLRTTVFWGLFCYAISLRYPYRQKSGVIKSGEYGACSNSHFVLISLSWNNFFSQPRELFDVWEFVLSCWSTVFIDLTLCIVPMMPKTLLALLHKAPYSLFRVSHFHPWTNVSGSCNF